MSPFFLQVWSELPKDNTSIYVESYGIVRHDLLIELYQTKHHLA